MTLRIGLLGAGRIGKVHAAAIGHCRGAALAAVADALPEAAQSVADEHDVPVKSMVAVLLSFLIEIFTFIKAPLSSGSSNAPSFSTPITRRTDSSAFACTCPM